jgi:hypothetical protein
MSDLDEEEIEATKKIYIDGIQSEDYGGNSLTTYPKQTIISTKIYFEEKIEKTADEMFEDENYIKEFYDKMGDSTTEEKCEVLVYRYYVSEEEIETQIEFYLEDEEVGINGLLNKRVLKAINKKCKEKGWI